MKYQLAAIALYATVGSAFAQAQVPMSAFGLEIGKPIDLPACEYVGSTKSVVMLQQKTCFEPASPVSQNRDKVHFGMKEVPSIVSGFSMIVKIVDGNLEALYFNTPGIEAKDRILSALTEKYGVPTKLTKENLQNSYGAQYESFNATWDTPTLYVEYSPTSSGSLKAGFASVETQRTHKLRVDALKELAKQKRAL